MAYDICPYLALTDDFAVGCGKCSNYMTLSWIQSTSPSINDFPPVEKSSIAHLPSVLRNSTETSHLQCIESLSFCTPHYQRRRESRQFCFLASDPRAWLLIHFQFGTSAVIVDTDVFFECPGPGSPIQYSVHVISSMAPDWLTPAHVVSSPSLRLSVDIARARAEAFLLPNSWLGNLIALRFAPSTVYGTTDRKHRSASDFEGENLQHWRVPGMGQKHVRNSVT